ncbi:MAG: sulfite exporter TauE/SafE family protein [Microcoleus sp. CSU_2_2]|nr:sulfite exporter TauE/SafE family protein [Microcoleus sp. SU_5_3]NJS09250.1 sulfite exporter TauE/SafE family protein [Microcoleus sp. CSU_2_2]
MTISELLILAAAGLFAGILAGFLGIGGGTVLVPLLVALKYAPLQAVATSSLSIVITAISGSIQNWRMGYLSLSQVAGIGFPAIITAQIGVYLAGIFPPYLLLVTFGLLLWFNIYLVEVRKRLTANNLVEEEPGQNPQLPITNDRLSDRSNVLVNPIFARIATGSAAGLLAGLFGVGGGVIMVPLQILLLGESIKTAIQTSLGVIVITAISATLGHAARGNVLWVVGLILGGGGLLGAQISTRFLPRLSDRVVSFAFRSLLAILSIYVFWQAWQKLSY